jgi:hypothetical protein
MDSKKVTPSDFLTKHGKIDGAMSLAEGSYKGLMSKLKDGKFISNKVFAFYFPLDKTKDNKGNLVSHNFITLGGYE